jgi:hypothetical protein
MSYIGEALANLGQWRVKHTLEVAGEGKPDGISGALLLCLGLRESGLKNILNAAGTDRGCFQISDRYHSAWLKSVPGCPAGSWYASAGHTAMDKGFCPRFSDGLAFAIHLLHDGQEFGHDHGVKPEDLTRFAVAAYNAGSDGALRGYRAGDVDQHTTGHDYSAWVLEHKHDVAAWLNNHPGWQP